MASCAAPLGLLLFLLGRLASGSLCADLLAAPTRTDTAPGLGVYAMLLALTLVCEAPAYFALWRATPPAGRARFAAVLLTLNLATHPLAVYGFPQFLRGEPWIHTVLAAEAFAFGVEAMILREVFNWSVRRAMVGAVLANATSWWAGAYLWDLFHGSL